MQNSMQNSMQSSVSGSMPGAMHGASSSSAAQPVIKSQESQSSRRFFLTSDIFDIPDLDIYEQMTAIVLRSYTSETGLPSIDDITRQGRMSPKNARKSLQKLVDIKMLSHRALWRILGDFGDDRLSWAAKGLLAFRRQHPHASLAQVVELAEQSSDNENTIHSALEELKRYGYLDDEANRDLEAKFEKAK